MNNDQPESKRVIVGRIVGLYGVQGWMRIFSETEPRENILHYNPWLIGPKAQVCEVLEGKRHRKTLIARLAGYPEREQAALLIGQEIAVLRAQLPQLLSNELYWIDLIGLQVVTLDGFNLGRVERLFATGANDVLSVRSTRERLLPLLWDQVIKRVDLEQGLIEVDWDPEF